MKKNETQKLCEMCKEKEVEHIHHKDGNPKNNELKNLQGLCTLCHAKVHNISPKQSELKRIVILRDRAIRIRNALDNQIMGLGRIEFAVPSQWGNERKFWDEKIKDYEKGLKQMLEGGEYPIWDKFLKDVKGISTITAAKLIAYIDIHNSPTVSALWRYCGLDATHVKRTNKISEEEALKFGNPYLKKELLGILGDNFIKQRTPIYRKIYEEEKERQLERHKNGECERCTKLKLNKKPGHAHAMARRKAVKIFVSHLWQEWRKLEGLSVSEPYSIAILNHSQKIEVKEVLTYV